MPILSKRLKFLRTRFGLSQEDLARKAGTTQQAIQQAEKGRARQPRYLPALAQALDIPLEWMMTGALPPHDAANSNKASKLSLHGLKEDDELLQTYYAMPKKDRDLIYELMKSRAKK